MSRAIFLIAAGLALANSILVLGSAVMLSDGSTLIISAIVAGLFAAIAGLLGIVDHHLSRLRRLVSAGGIEPSVADRLRPSLGKLALWLSVAALGIGLIMAIALTGILQRLSTGTAVFG